MSKPIGVVPLTRILDAINSLKPEHRAPALVALREADPDTRYFTLHDGRVDAVASCNEIRSW
jgi:hypothetical protein